MHQQPRPRAIALTALVVAACSSPSVHDDRGGDQLDRGRRPHPPALWPRRMSRCRLRTSVRFTCDLSLHEDATVARTNITDVRTGTRRRL